MYLFQGKFCPDICPRVGLWGHMEVLCIDFFFCCFLFVCLFVCLCFFVVVVVAISWAAPAAYGGSQARG